MSRVKDTYIELSELVALKEYATDDLEDRSPESLKFHAWAIEQKTIDVCRHLNIDQAGLPEFLKWCWEVCSDDLLDEYLDTYVDTAEAIFGYYRQAYKAQVA